MALASTQASLEIQALLGQGTRCEGKLLFEGRVRIDGEFHGDVVSSGTLIVGPTAEVRGTINVGSLIVCGGMGDAKVGARASVELLTQSRCYAKIKTPHLFVARGPPMEGHCNPAKFVPAFPPRPEVGSESPDVSLTRVSPLALRAPSAEL